MSHHVEVPAVGAIHLESATRTIVDTCREAR